MKQKNLPEAVNQAQIQKLYLQEKDVNSGKLDFLNALDKQLLFQEIYKEMGIHRKRDIAIFEVALYCALRASEVSEMQLTNYNPIDHTIYCHRLKGSKSNTLKIVDQHVIKALNDYLEERLRMKCNTTALFVSQKGNAISRQRLDAMMKKYCRQAQYIHPAKWHMHVLKHTRAVDLAEAGCDVDDIQFWLGHKNVANTFIYLEYTIGLRKQLFTKLSMLEGGTYEDRYKPIEKEVITQENT